MNISQMVPWLRKRLPETKKLRPTDTEAVAQFVLLMRHKKGEELKQIITLIRESPHKLGAHRESTLHLLEILGAPVFHDPAFSALEESSAGLLTSLSEELVTLLSKVCGDLGWGALRSSSPDIARKLLTAILQLIVLLFERFPNLRFDLSLLRPRLADLSRTLFASGASASAAASAASASEASSSSCSHGATLMEQYNTRCDDFNAEQNQQEADLAAQAAKRQSDREAAKARREAGLDEPVLEGAAAVAYRTLDVIPSVEELQNDADGLPHCNIVRGRYRNAHHLLNTHTRLMKEDVVRPLREGVTEWLANRRHGQRSEQVNVYERVQFTGLVCDKDQGLIWRITFQSPRRGMDWSRTSRLMYGSLVLLSNDRLQSPPTWCEVFVRDDKFMTNRERPSVDLRVLQGPLPVQHLGGASDWTMIEASQSYFLPYRHVCAALQRLGATAELMGQPAAAAQPQLPFVRYLVDAQRQVDAPVYLRMANAAQYDMAPIFPELERRTGRKTFDILQRWPAQLAVDAQASLDEAQRDALRHLLTKEVAVVQGPPGTGKTYVALKALRVLLHPTNRRLRGDKSPVLIVALTNHALDQLLEGVLKFEGNIIRVGSRSESEALQDKTMYAARQRAREQRERTGRRLPGMGALMSARERHMGAIIGGLVSMRKGVTLDVLRAQGLATEQQIVELEQRKEHKLDGGALELLSESEAEDSDNDGSSGDEGNDRAAAGRGKHKDSVRKGPNNGAKNQHGRKGAADGKKANAFKGAAAAAAAAASSSVADGEWQEVRNKKTVKIIRSHEIVDFWLREGEIAQEREQKKQRREAAAAQQAQKQQAERMARQRNQFDALADEVAGIQLNGAAAAAPAAAAASARKPAPAPQYQSASSGPHVPRASNGRNPHDGNEAAFFIDEDDAAVEEEEDAEEVAREQAERAVDEDMAKVKYEMAKIKEAVCPQGYNRERVERELLHAAPLFAMSARDRQWLHWYWLQEWRAQILADLEPALSEFEKLNREIKEHHRLADVSLLRDAACVGMTTTGAASMQALVQLMQPKIVVIEESAEVLESHILACLSPSVQHLMLIGDHKQLQPTTSHFDLTRLFKLHVSLFERLINNEIEHRQLATQRRMRPCIRELSSFHYDDTIHDGPNVQVYPPVTGVEVPLYFFAHTVREGGDHAEHEKTNQFEAEMSVRLGIYLCNSGHQPSDITILTTYKGQLRLIRKTMQTLIPNAKDRKHAMITRVVDKYQGEENKIIVLSLVRSNGPQTAANEHPQRNPLGYLNRDQRMCVALSRAKHGMYVFGNFDMLRKHSASWRIICERVLWHGNELPLRCARHNSGTVVRQLNDFKKVPEGGCSVPCSTRMPCGHTCKLVCHGYDVEHVELPCRDLCHSKYADCAHRCEKRCHKGAMFPEKEKVCPPCPKLIDRAMPGCQHVQRMPCGQDPDTFACQHPVIVELPCGHTQQVACHAQQQPPRECHVKISVTRPCGHEQRNVRCSQQNNLGTCTQVCSAPLECGDPCPLRCHSLRPLEHGSCSKRCTRTLLCSHPCKSQHGCREPCPPCPLPCANRCVHAQKCSHPCMTPCPPCKEPCPWHCEHHRCTRKCGEPCDRPYCMEACKRRLRCGHLCVGVCGEPCLPFCRQPGCPGADTPVMDDSMMQSALSEEDNAELKFIRLEDCGHVFEVDALDRLMAQSMEQTGGAIRLPCCPNCRTPIRRSVRYGTIVNSVLNDIEHIKMRRAAEEEELLEQFLQDTEMKEEERQRIIEERRRVLSAVEGAASHWYRCANGHYYVIGECGGAMVRSRCPECPADAPMIGGSNHRLNDGSMPAFELGSQGSLWMPELRPEQGAVGMGTVLQRPAQPAPPPRPAAARLPAQPRVGFPFQLPATAETSAPAACASAATSQPAASAHNNSSSSSLIGAISSAAAPHFNSSSSSSGSSYHSGSSGSSSIPRDAFLAAAAARPASAAGGAASGGRTVATHFSGDAAAAVASAPHVVGPPGGPPLSARDSARDLRATAAEARRLQQDRELRAQQDREYDEALFIDQQRLAVERKQV